MLYGYLNSICYFYLKFLRVFLKMALDLNIYIS